VQNSSVDPAQAHYIRRNTENTSFFGADPEVFSLYGKKSGGFGVNSAKE